MKSRHERWLTETITDQFWEQQPDWRQILITRSAVFAELESEVARVVGPVLVELREDWSMWEIAAALIEKAAQRGLSNQVGVVRLYLYWMIDTHARHATDQSVLDACAPALECEHGNRPWSGSCYQCEWFFEPFEDGHRPMVDLLPGEEANQQIWARLAGAYRDAAGAGYTGEDLAAITARTVGGDSTAQLVIDQMLVAAAP